jgi:nucleotide-binding universal stress UspA family protein
MPDHPEMLVPFDGSTAAERLLRHACRVARAEDALLTVLCVVALPAGMMPDEAPSELDDTVLVALARAQEICREEGMAATFELSHARNLADAIVEEAERSGSTLICLSLEEHQPRETALMSPTVQAILAAAPCSVLLNDPATGLPPMTENAPVER